MSKKSLGRIIGSIYKNQQMVLNNTFEEYGIGSGQYSFYLAIANNEGLNQKEISILLNVNKATTNKAIKKLEALGYVETRIDIKDRRLHCVYLTQKGKSIIPKVREHLERYTELLGTNLLEEEVDQAYKYLEVIETNVKNLAKLIKEGKNIEK